MKASIKKALQNQILAMLEKQFGDNQVIIAGIMFQSVLDLEAGFRGPAADPEGDDVF